MKKPTPSAVTIFRLLSIKGVGPAKIRNFLRIAKRRELDFDDVVADEDQLARQLNDSQIAEFYGNKELIGETVERFENNGIGMIGITDADYPSQLERHPRHAPPLLFYRGNPALLAEPSVAFFGTRGAGQDAERIIEDYALDLARSQFNLVAGYGKGPDLIVHRSALSAGGTTTMVLAEGIDHFRVKGPVSAVWDWQRLLVITEFLPKVIWSLNTAMQRDLTLCSLCDGVVVVQPNQTGGAIAAAFAGLDMELPVFAPVIKNSEGDSTGSRELVRAGAIQINERHEESVGGPIITRRLMRVLGMWTPPETEEEVDAETALDASDEANTGRDVDEEGAPTDEVRAEFAPDLELEDGVADDGE